MILIQRRKHYVGGNARLVVIDHDGSYLDFVTQTLRIFCINLFMINYILLDESLKYLITITSDEDLTNILEDQECLTTSIRSTPRFHFFVVPKSPSLISNSTLDKMLEASIKITTTKF